MVRINPDMPSSQSDALTEADLETALQLQKDAFKREPYPAWSVRKARLETLRDVLYAHEDELKAAIRDDFGHRSFNETLFADLIPTYNEIAYMLKHGEKWMRRRKKSVEITQMGASAEIIPQPLGVIGIISPWNYPINLTAPPMAAAFTAGNSVMVKLSEYTPRYAELFKRMMGEVYDPEIVFVATGGADVAKAFSSLTFDHLLFTGSTSVGRHVARAAGENLVPVTLELGGKSPVLISDDADMDMTVASIATGKTLNAGQTCIAPDYVLMPQSRIDAFSAALIQQTETMFPKFAGNADYSSIIADSHYARLQDLLDDAESKGATVRVAGSDDKQQLAKERRIPLTVVTNTTPDMKIRQEEIFGPLLPIVASETTDDQIAFVKDHPRPLALYHFSKDKATQDRVLLETHAGGVATNETMWHFVQSELPFGGIGPSGIGRYHGEYGFDAFSHMKGVFHQSTGGIRHMIKKKLLAGLAPPYGEKANKLATMARKQAGVKE
ncbi:coniferyl aldehyde dehydrogenase [Algimonas porphyrae]|uniref:Aldehyde dehydrogenase n=1 Tax=Algimonas porphyrae TaxID=1128113 RepID=A0ABQ5UXH4_9PROT|nr:coniferyl aldehyde dehydrogenase [Algimonas porphyrae]GLQ19991.1 putative coniferyl aldehyde dehydrogenase [Algimonas porphyrae]